MAKVKVKNLYIPQGSRYTLDILYLQEDEETPVDMSNLMARCHFKENVNDVNILFDATDYTSVVESTSHILIQLPADVTELFDWNEAYYDIEVYDPADYAVVDRILQGSVIVNKNVTVEDTNL